MYGCVLVAVLAGTCISGSGDGENVVVMVIALISTIIKVVVVESTARVVDTMVVVPRVLLAQVVMVN